MERDNKTKYQKNDRVSINTSNADGSIPSLSDYHGTVEEVVSDERVMVRADDEARFRCHIARLTKL